MKVCVKCGAKYDSSGWVCPSCHTAPELIEGYPALSPELAESCEGFKADYFAQLACLEPNNFWFRSRNRLIIWALQRYFAEAKKFFEIGCGTGFVLSGIENALPYLSLYGSEIYSIGLVYAGKRLKSAELFQMDASRIPFENEFDLIGAFDVLEHIEEDELVLSQMYQAVRQNGGIILTVPQHPFLWSQVDVYACHVRRYKAWEMKVKVERAGFKVIRMTSFVSLLLPLMLGSRLIKRKPDRKYDSLSELKLGRLTNVFLGKVLDLEHILIKSGFSLPFGGSLLLIARKD